MTNELENFEEKIYKIWLERKYFSADFNNSKKPYGLLIPPPNLTGELHLGHALQHSVLDAVARFKRIQGFDVLLLPGVDHAGIQFEGTFDKYLQKKDLSKKKLGRDKWLEMAWQFKDGVYKSVSMSWRLMGISADWSKEVFTLDPAAEKAVYFQFKNFFDKGLIYKGPYIVQWCPKCNTAIEDVEIEYEERLEKLYFLKYGPLTLATARPETKFGDTAMAVNPNDKRYKDFVGKEFEIETLNGKKIMKVIADEAVVPDFGTGVIKVTPGHDFTDYEIGKRHNLPIVQVIDKEGRLTEVAGKYAGMKVSDAREAMLPELKEKGILVKIEDYKHSVAVCERCRTVVEPLISEEWFVKMGHLAKLGKESIKRGEVEFSPVGFEWVISDWLDNIHDWCISRSLWWGHRIPVWYCSGKKAVGKKMGFAHEVVPQLFTGKTKTYRLRSKNFVVGDRVAFEDSKTGKIIGFGTIADITKTTVGELPLNDQSHGAVYKKIEELISAFKKHYPELKVSEDTIAFIYKYEFTSRNESDECCGLPTVSLEKPQKCPKCGCDEMRQDDQVLDTWFSSGLWPLITLGWPFAESDSAQGKHFNEKVGFDPKFERFYPWSFEISAPEIKFLWIARMIMLGSYFTGRAPFKKMFFHGTLRDLQGRKFSKSLGNGIDPVYLIGKWGVDATRMALYTYSIPGRDGRVSKEILDERGKNFRNFVTKLRNISRFVFELAPEERESELKFIYEDDLRIKNLLELLITKTTFNLESLNLHLAAEDLYNFVWHEFADVYIEKTKKRRAVAQPVLEHVLKNVLILLHPFMPFITEDLYQKFSDKKESIILESWPA